MVLGVPLWDSGGPSAGLSGGPFTGLSGGPFMVIGVPLWDSGVLSQGSVGALCGAQWGALCGGQWVRSRVVRVAAPPTPGLRPAVTGPHAAAVTEAGQVPAVRLGERNPSGAASLSALTPPGGLAGPLCEAHPWDLPEQPSRGRTRRPCRLSRVRARAPPPPAGQTPASSSRQPRGEDMVSVSGEDTP